MKPYFTIHAGEYLTGAYIEENCKEANVYVPTKDTGIDLLITSKDSKKIVSLQVKSSKDFNATHEKTSRKSKIKGSGWWTLDRNKIKSSKADFWIFILHSFESSNDFIIIDPKLLLEFFSNLDRKEKKIQSYITVTKHGTAFETRQLKDIDKENICDNKYESLERDLTKHLNNWGQIFDILK
jgi:hypothetical protein